MPRNISTALAAHLASTQTTLAKLVLVTRIDGTVFGFTSTTTNIVFGGNTYYPSDGAMMSAIENKAGTSIDNLEVSGILASSRITDSDIAGKLYNGASVLVQLVNYADLTQGALILFSGYVGEIVTENSSYRFELRGMEQLLKQRVGKVTSPLCRCFKLGDACCKVNMSGNTQQSVAIRSTHTVSAVSTDGTQITFSSTTPVTATYNFGNVKFVTGLNTGLIKDIKTHVLSGSSAVITLRQAFPNAVSIGDTAQLEVGCDRSANICNTRFNNLANFHGEPDIPGNNTYSIIGRS